MTLREMFRRADAASARAAGRDRGAGVRSSCPSDTDDPATTRLRDRRGSARPFRRARGSRAHTSLRTAGTSADAPAVRTPWSLLRSLPLLGIVDPGRVTGVVEYASA